MRFIRSAIAVLSGFIVMMVVVRLTLLPAAMGVGLDRLRDPVSGVMTRWFVFMVEWPTSLFAAVLGGVLAALLAGRHIRERVGVVLAGFVMITGLALAAVPQAEMEVGADRADASGPRVAQLPPRPTWDRLVLPILGGMGVLLGVRFVDRAGKGLAVPEPTEDLPAEPS